ncbi:MAG: hypothetical protein ACJ796_01875 [Gemmatimonadaceae bacterium]
MLLVRKRTASFFGCALVMACARPGARSLRAADCDVTSVNLFVAVVQTMLDSTRDHFPLSEDSVARSGPRALHIDPHPLLPIADSRPWIRSMIIGSGGNYQRDSNEVVAARAGALRRLGIPQYDVTKLEHCPGPLVPTADRSRCPAALVMVGLVAIPDSMSTRTWVPVVYMRATKDFRTEVQTSYLMEYRDGHWVAIERGVQVMVE